MAAFLFLFCFSAYLAGTAPSLYGGDSGELIASAAVLGISHAPGYPLHALLGKAFASAVAWGGFAFRVNAMSATLTALTVAGLFQLLRRLWGSPPAALIGALLWGATPIAWDQAQTAEVFALNNAFAAALLLAWPFWNKASTDSSVSAPDLRRFRGWAFLYGLALANHQTIFLLAPGFATLFVRHFGLRGAVVSWKKWLSPAIFTAAGLSLYLYLPLRSADHPPVNFGDPHTPKRFYNAVTRKEFGSLELHPAAVPFRTVKTLAQQLGSFSRQNSAVIGGLAAAAGLAGLLIMRDRCWLVFWIFSGPLFFWMSNLSPTNTLAQWRLERFQLLPSLFLCVGAASLAASALVCRRVWPVALLAAGLFVEQGAALDRPWFRWNLAFRDFGRNLTASLSERSVLLIDGLFFDEPTSCLLNRLLVEKQRPDLRIIYRPGTLFELFYGEDFLEIPRPARGKRRVEREAVLWRSLDRPLSALALAWEALPDLPAPPAAWTLDGLVYRRGGSARSEPMYLHRSPAGRPVDYPTRLILVHYPYFRAKAAFEAQNPGAATRAAAQAVFLGRGMEWLRSNLGSLWSRLSANLPPAQAGPALQCAIGEFEAGAVADPYFGPAHFGVGYVRVRENKWPEAASAFAQAVRLKPDWAEAYYMLGFAYTSGGRPDLARHAWERFLALDPASPLAGAVRQALGR